MEIAGICPSCMVTLQLADDCDFPFVTSKVNAYLFELCQKIIFLFNMFRIEIYNFIDDKALSALYLTYTLTFQLKDFLLEL